MDDEDYSLIWAQRLLTAIEECLYEHSKTKRLGKKDSAYKSKWCKGKKTAARCHYLLRLMNRRIGKKRSVANESFWNSKWHEYEQLWDEQLVRETLRSIGLKKNEQYIINWFLGQI